MTARPRWHFTAPAGWLNDPHGVAHIGDHYEIFFQYVPDSTAWNAGCNWGAASGRDLLSLGFDGVALSPDDSDDGIWTGSRAQSEGVDRIFYTAVTLPNVDLGRIRSADRVGEEWVKGSIVIDAPPNISIFRDPCVVRVPDGWLMIVGAQLNDGRAAIIRYESADLRNWVSCGIALEGAAGVNPTWSHGLWECPQLIQSSATSEPAGLLASVWHDGVLHDVIATSGHWVGPRFEGVQWEQLTYGGVHYAPTVFRDADGEQAVLFWLRGVEDRAAGWAGALSLPYRVTVAPDGVRLSLHPDVWAHAVTPVAASSITTSAVLTWDAPVGGELVVSSQDRVVCTVRCSDRELRLTSGSTTETVPRRTGDIFLTVDVGIIELLTDSGLLGVRVPDVGSQWRVEATGAVAVRPLT